MYDGIEFCRTGVPFNESTFEWAKEVAPIIHGLEEQSRKKVLEYIEGWDFDESTTRLLSVDLDEYGNSMSLHQRYVGDESWGDVVVTVVITNGEIVDVYGDD